MRQWSSTAEPYCDKNDGDDGYCYLCLYDLDVRCAVAKILGPYPRASMVLSLGGYDSFMLSVLAFVFLTDATLYYPQ